MCLDSVHALKETSLLHLEVSFIPHPFPINLCYQEGCISLWLYSCYLAQRLSAGRMQV